MEGNTENGVTQATRSSVIIITTFFKNQPQDECFIKQRHPLVYLNLGQVEVIKKAPSQKVKPSSSRSTCIYKYMTNSTACQ